MDKSRKKRPPSGVQQTRGDGGQHHPRQQAGQPHRERQSRSHMGCPTGTPTRGPPPLGASAPWSHPEGGDSRSSLPYLRSSLNTRPRHAVQHRTFSKSFSHNTTRQWHFPTSQHICGPKTSTLLWGDIYIDTVQYIKKGWVKTCACGPNQAECGPLLWPIGHLVHPPGGMSSHPRPGLVLSHHVRHHPGR